MAWLASALGASRVDTWFTELNSLVQNALLAPLNSSRLSREQTTMPCGMSHGRKVLGKRRSKSFFFYDLVLGVTHLNTLLDT